MELAPVNVNIFVVWEKSVNKYKKQKGKVNYCGSKAIFANIRHIPNLVSLQDIFFVIQCVLGQSHKAYG